MVIDGGLLIVFIFCFGDIGDVCFRLRFLNDCFVFV